MTRKQRREREEWERRARQRAAEAAYPDAGGYVALAGDDREAAL